MNTHAKPSLVRRSLAATAILLSSLTGATAASLVASAPAGAASALPTSLSDTSLSTGDYTSTLTEAPVRQQGATTQTITNYFNSSKFSVSGGATVPEGWSTQYTCNHGQTWDALSYYGCVNGVRTVGDLTSLGLNAGSQVWQGSQSSGADGPSRIQLTGGGDGWTAIVSPDGSRVFNVYHHGSPSQIDCHLIADGTQCPGFRANTHWVTSTRSSVAIVGTQLFMAGGDSNVDGFTCINFDGTSCGNPTVISGTHNEVINSVSTTVKNIGNHGDWCGACNNFVNEVAANGKVLAIDTGTLRLGCYDTTTSSTCAGQPARGFDIGLTYNPSAANFFDMSSVAVGSKVYFTTPPTTANGGAAGGSGYGGKVSCFDTDTLDTCSGAWPVTSAGSQAVSASGTQQAGDICTLGSQGAKCYDSAGSLQSSSSVLNSLLTGVLAPGAGYGGHGNATTIGTRFIWARGGWTQLGGSVPWVECFDTATNAQCAHFPLTGSAFDSATGGAAQGSVYTVEPDPTKANCMWTNDNFANILSWNLNTGTPGCAPPGADFVATYQAAKVFPRLTCNGDAVNSWGKLKVTDVSGGSYSQALLTVEDSNGNVISGWDGVPIPTVKGVLTTSLAGLSPSATGLSPKFQVKLVGLDSGSGQATVTVSKTGSAPELCVGLVAKAFCPSLNALAAGAKPFAFNAAVDSYLDVTTTNGNAPTIHSSAVAHVTAPTLAQCQQKPDPPTGTLGDYSAIGALKMKLVAPDHTGGAVPNTLTYSYRLNGGAWQAATPDANGRVVVTGLAGNTQECVEVKTENLWGSSDAASLGCTVTHGSWTCQSDQAFIINDGQLGMGAPWTSMPPVDAVGNSINALAYNPFDQMLYGIMNGPNQHLVEMASDGAQIDLGPISGLPLVIGKGYVAGDIDPATGIYYVSSAASSLYAVDIASRTATPVTIPLNVQVSGGLGADLAVRDGIIWSVNRSNVVGIDPGSGNGIVSVMPENMRGAVPGAVWSSDALGGIVWQAPRAHSEGVWSASINGSGFVSNFQRLGSAVVTSGAVYDGATCR